MVSFLRSFAKALVVLAFPLVTQAQGVGVGTATPAPAAALDVTSTSKGLLLPRMTATQRAAIASPPQGLFVFQTDGTPGLYYYVGIAWVNISNGLIPDANGNAGPSPTVQVSTLAGSSSGFADGTGTAAQFSGPNGVAVDGSGNVYIADLHNNRIRKIVIATGAVSTVAGSGTSGSADGMGTAAQFSGPIGVAYGSGNVYVADLYNHRIRKVVVATGAVSTLAGSGIQGFADGTSTVAKFNYPSGVAVDASGNVYVAEQGNNSIRKVVVATGAVSTLAGNGAPGSADGTGAAAQFANPTAVAVDASGNVYVADYTNNRIRKVVVATSAVSTLAGSGQGFADGTGIAAQFYQPNGVAVDGSGNVYVGDAGNNRIRKIVAATGAVSTLAGSGTQGAVDATGVTSQFNFPSGVAVDGSGNVYIADLHNNRIRLIKP